MLWIFLLCFLYTVISIAYFVLHSTAIRVYAQTRYALQLHLFTNLLYNGSQITQATAIVGHPPLPSVLLRIAFWLLPPVPCQRRLAVEHLTARSLLLCIEVRHSYQASPN